MGTDIHMIVQRKDGYGRWRECGIPGFGARSYSLFAALANVRNGFGFAGVYTHEPIKPIAEPRGLPTDVPDPATRRSGKIGGEYYPRDVWWDNPPSLPAVGVPGRCQAYLGEHSQSFLKLTEILAYDWGQPLREEGVVNAEGFRDFERDGAPKQWAGRVEGPSVRLITNGEMRERIASNTTTGPAGPHFYTRVGWSAPLRESIPDSWWTFVAALKSAAGENTDSVRIVFGFDS